MRDRIPSDQGIICGKAKQSRKAKGEFCARQELLASINGSKNAVRVVAAAVITKPGNLVHVQVPLLEIFESTSERSRLPPPTSSSAKQG
jgi:hypothetical protein